MNRVFQVLAGLVLALYPLLIFFGLQVMEPAHMAGLLLAMALLRMASPRTSPGDMGAQLVLTAALLVIAAFTLVAESPSGFRYYPVAVNLVFLSVFCASLIKGPPIVERLARLTEPHLPQQAVAYTRKVTILWCVFFLFNGSIALYTAAFASFEAWAYYNGFLAYILMAVLFSLEWLVRRSVRRRVDATPQRTQ